jgi:hypothetical protein
MGLLDYGLGGVAYDLDPTSAGPIRPPSDVGSGGWIAQPRGTSRRYRAGLVDPSTGQPVAPGRYDLATTPSAILWAGGPSAILARPSAAWDTADRVAVVVTVAAADLAGLESQPYPLRVLVSEAGDDPESVFDGWLEVLDAPATGSAPTPVYGNYSELIRHGGSRLAQFLTADQLAGFLAERGEAREWLDGLILAHYRPKYTSYYGVGMAYTYGTGSLFPLGIGSLGYPVAQQGPDPILRDALAAGGLAITPKVSEAVALYAVSLILGRQSSGDFQSSGLAARIRAEALAGSLVAIISTNGQDSANLAVNLSVFDGRDI